MPTLASLRRLVANVSRLPETRAGIRARAIGFHRSSAQPFLQHVDPDFLSPLSLHYGDDTPYIPVNLNGHLLPFLLDTGAAVSVLPKAKLVPLLTKSLIWPLIRSRHMAL